MGGSRVTFEWSSEQDTPTYVMEILALEMYTWSLRGTLRVPGIYGV